MTRSFSNAKLLSFIFSDAVSTAFSRRGFAAAAQGAGPTSAKLSAGALIINKEESVASSFKITWGPDPTTGYYRPDTGVEEIDVAELRATLLNKKNKNKN